MTDPYGRTPAGLIQRIMQRLTSVESRLARGGSLPDRIGEDGLQVTDWNTATDVGFYWGSGASNQPSGATKWVGITESADGGATLVQTLTRPDAPTEPARTRVYAAGAWGPWVMAATNTMAAGLMQPYGGSAPPTGWLLCTGQAVSRTTYAALFTAIGTTWGAGDGSTTFNVPDMRGRTAFGVDTAQTEFTPLAKAGGEKAHVLTINEMPSHSHQWMAAGTSNPGGVPGNWDDIVGANTSSLGLGPANPEDTVANAIRPRGGGAAHNILPPYVSTNWIISTGALAAPPGGSPTTATWGILDPNYKGGQAQVAIQNGSLSGPYDWRTSYQPNGPRLVSIVPRDNTYEIVGQAEALNGMGFAPMAMNTAAYRSYGALNLARDWNDRIGATRLPSGLIVLSGMPTSIGTPAQDTVIGTLPPGYRPEYQMILPVEQGDTAKAVTVYPDGTVRVRSGYTAGQYVSLDGLAFWAAQSDATGNWVTVGNGGSSFGANFNASNAGYNTTYGYPAFYKDRYGFVWFRGLVTIAVAPTGDNTAIINLPATHRAALEQHFRATANDAYSGLGAQPVNGLNWKTNSPTGVGGWISLASAVIQTSDAAASNTWITPGFANGWANNNTASFPAFGLTLRGDGLIKARGLLNGPATVNLAITNMSGYPEFWPRAHRIITATISNNSRARIDFMGDGENNGRTPRDIAPISGVAASTWASFDGIQFVP